MVILPQLLVTFLGYASRRCNRGEACLIRERVSLAYSQQRMMCWYNKKQFRHVPKSHDRILDALDLMDNCYLNLLAGLECTEHGK